MSTQRLFKAIPPVMTIALLAGTQVPAQAAQQTAVGGATIGSCDVEALSASKAAFLRLSTLRDSDGTAVADEELRQASAEYVMRAEVCYQALYGSSSTTQPIDDGGVWFSPDGSQPFVTKATKWGAGSPFAGGTNVPGPRLPGGTVTYSLVGNGVSNSAEPADATVAITSLPTFSACFLTEISNAFAAWSAVANIQFIQVADNGVAFNAAGATGDIRVGAHSFDGPFGTLAHGFFPPPNGTSAAGDVHFDRQENWSCAAGSGGIDIGIVALHEFGHAIGLDHEGTNTAVMNPIYNPAITSPLADDINGASSIYGSPPVVHASVRVGDYDGDGKTDLALYRPSSAGWYVVQSSTNFLTAFITNFGLSSDVPLRGDYDGDGKGDLALYRPSDAGWYIAKSSTNFLAAIVAHFGLSTDIPIPGDYDGDGKNDLALYRPSDAGWYIALSSTNFLTAFVTHFGLSTDIPVPGDYDGDGKTDLALYRPSDAGWYIALSSTNFLAVFVAHFGLSTDLPLRGGDYDGDGKADLALYRPSDAGWYIAKSSTNFLTAIVAHFGLSTDTPIPGDYDGDGKYDLALYRPSDAGWYIALSSTNFLSAFVTHFGLNTDIPVLRRP